MCDEGQVKKYQIVYAVQDFYFCEVGERKVFKKYMIMHFTKNVKEVGKELVNFCFSGEEMAKSKLKNCRLREKGKVVMKWIKLLKEGMLKFRDYRGRD
jgi:type VI protein secretion system component Hcp